MLMSCGPSYLQLCAKAKITGALYTSDCPHMGLQWGSDYV